MRKVFKDADVNRIFFELKKEKLFQIYKHCLLTVPYYRDSWGKVVAEDQFDYDYFSSNITILEKHELKVNTDLFVSDNMNKHDLTIDVTSGTEGKPLICYKSKGERIRCSNALWLKRRAWVNDLSPKDKFARFYAFRTAGDNSLVTDSVIYKDNDIHIPLNDMSKWKLTEYWNHILSFQPRWMHGPSTAICNLAKHIKESMLPFYQIEFIELNGEFVTEEQLALIRSVFQCKVANHYGSREFWALGFSCKEENHIHIMDQSVFIESIYNQDFGANEILITSLTNKAWPLVRYRLGDMADLRYKDNCRCGSKGKFYLELRGGRRADYFTLRGGLTLNAILFSGVSRGISNREGRASVYQYQVIKKSDSLIIVRLCLAEEAQRYSNDVIAKYDKELRKIIGKDIEIQYELVDNIIPDPLTGKCKDFIDLSV